VFDVRAESQVREYLIRLHAFGKTTQPQVLLSSEPSLPEGDIISLLTLGVTSRDRANANTSAGAGIAAEALYQASGLDRQVQKFLPRNSVIRDLSFHVSTLYNDANGLVEPTVQLESKFLTDQLKLGLSQPVSGKGTRALAEYRFDDRVSAQIQWDNVYNDVAIGNLGVDLKLRWNVE
jgi:translocation and assembly module TamB